MLFYTLKNGETIELKITNKTDEKFNAITEIEIILFGGTTTITQTFNDFEQINLNKIFEEIERDYEELKTKDEQHFWNCYTN